ncbi:MAG TPA: hypothetical protein VMT19_04830 [Thermoanaerobaculaceae bacterium]|nr:hypothetical protein [Thermoanaerobaculaceae bacterium]
MRDRVWRGAAAASILLLAVGCLAGCTTISVSSTHYLGVPEFPATDPGAVEILRQPPRRPHERLGEVVLAPSGSPSVAEMEQAIRVEAARMGADAAVLVFDKTRRIGTVVEGPWWSRTARPIYGRRIVAVAIRYR